MSSVFFLSLSTYAQAIIPWVVFGSILAYLVERFVPDTLVKRYFHTNGFVKVAGAMALGMISPLSIMSFLPVAGELVALGASPGLLLAFFIAERAYDFQSFLIVTQLFGWQVALINIIAIYGALLVMAWLLGRHALKLNTNETKPQKSFIRRQARLMTMVCVGIVLGAALRALIPEALFESLAGSNLGGTLVALFLGLVLYFGPLLGNYPVARAFADIGMSQMGVVVFLSVSPVFNAVIIMLFSSMAGFRKVIQPIFIYSLVALGLSVGLSLIL